MKDAILDNFLWAYDKRDYETDTTLVELFEAAAGAYPNQSAVIFLDSELSYGNLNIRSNQLARFLRDAGVVRGDRVVVSMGRGTDVYVAILAIQKIGCAYVPMEPSNPIGRIRYLINDSRPTAIVCDSSVFSKLEDWQSICINLSKIDSKLAELKSSNLNVNFDPTAVSDIIYTSGTTGAPNGVVTSHKARVNAVRMWEEIYKLGVGDRCFQTTSLAFDVFTADWTRSFSLGSTICPSFANYTVGENPPIDKLYEQLVRERVNFAEFNITTIRKLMNYVEENEKLLSFLDTIIVGADAWFGGEDDRLNRLCEGQTRIINAYGMTEATVDSTYFTRGMLEEGAMQRHSTNSLVGRPFPSVKVAILDQNGCPTPQGKTGTMYFGGEGLADGYWERPMLTNERFLFFEGHGRFYCSGDLARVNEDNVLEFLGRSDNQLEIGSKRVEVFEIEACILEHSKVKDIAVIGRRLISNEMQLEAFLVVEEPTQIFQKEIRESLRSKLPQFMIPAAYHFLDALPLGATGKVDRSKLLVMVAEVPP